MTELNNIHSDEKKVVAIGKFDGVHIGHKKLLQTAAGLAKEAGLVSVALVISSKRGQKLLSDDDREKYIKSVGIDCCVVQELTSEFMSMTADKFIEEILVKKLNCTHVVVGYNFRFAKGRCANVNVLKSICCQKGIKCTIIPEVTCDTDSGTVTASSSNVRDFLYNGDVKSAADILGRFYRLSGEVVHGREIGRTLDAPTANIDVSHTWFLPDNGVYATKVSIDGETYNALTNIGDNPTINDKGNITIETYIIDFKDDIYGREISIEFTDRIRDEIKFTSLDELKEQIQKDIDFVIRNSHK